MTAHIIEKKRKYIIYEEKRICRMLIWSHLRRAALSEDRSPKQLPRSVKIQYPMNTMLVCVINIQGDVMPPFITLHTGRLNTEAYDKCLVEAVLSTLKKLATELWIQQQNLQNQTLGYQSMPATTSFITSDLLSPKTATPQIIRGRTQLNDRPTTLLATIKVNWR